MFFQYLPLQYPLAHPCSPAQSSSEEQATEIDKYQINKNMNINCMNINYNSSCRRDDIPFFPPPHIQHFLSALLSHGLTCLHQDFL